MSDNTTIAAASKWPSLFAKASSELATLKAAEDFMGALADGPNSPGPDLAGVIGDAVYCAVYEKRVELLLLPVESAAQLFEKFVEIRVGGICEGHNCWNEVMARLLADTEALAMKEAAA